MYCGTEVAIKKIKIPRNDPDMMKYLKREVCLLKYVASSLPRTSILTVHVYSAIRHPHVVQFLGWSQPEDSEFLLLVEGNAIEVCYSLSYDTLEFAKGGNLSRFLSRNDILVSWDTRISICLDVARASKLLLYLILAHVLLLVLYLHKNKVIYRDLKSENILVP